MSRTTQSASRLSYANMASTLALVVAVTGVGGGAAWAASVAKNSVGSPQIKNGQVKTVDLAKNSVKGPKVANGSLSAADLGAAANEAFTAGPTAYFDDLNFHLLSSGDPDTTIFETTVPAGSYYAVSASGTIQNTGPDTNDFTCSLTQPVGEFTRTIATSEVRVANGGDLGTIALDGVALDSAGGHTVTMTCEGEQAPYAGQILDPRIVLVELGEGVEK